MANQVPREERMPASPVRPLRRRGQRNLGGKGRVRRFVVRGEVPAEGGGELFRCFVVPALRIDLKRPALAGQSQIILLDDRPPEYGRPGGNGHAGSRAAAGIEVRDGSPLTGY